MACNERRKSKNKSIECDKLDCWCFPDPYAKKKVKIINKKYCWLYPQRETKKLNQIVPSFDHCDTLYTKCDYILENHVSKQIILIEGLIRKYILRLTHEMSLQRKCASEMWKLSYKFLLLTQFYGCIKPYPDIVSNPAQMDIGCKFQKKMKSINYSNCRLISSLEALRFSIKKLNGLCDQMDMTVDSSFVKGTYRMKPLSYYRKLIDDTFEYFNDVLCKLKIWAQLLDIGDTNAIEDYKGLLEPTKKYDEFMNIGKEKCTCLRTKNPECMAGFSYKCN
ncbi:uncharacterized protein [Eurosta solidaginis]|uniref:uncharacterized protein isoform X2 n=1 Tax=Eurosta solidaginis TaxID=178769 RepID=UPI0035315295